MSKTILEDKFAEALTNAGISFQRWCHLIQNRRFESDFFLPPTLVVEIEGGVWINGRHNRPGGFISDVEKYNLYTANGLQLLRFTGKDLSAANIEATIKIVTETLERSRYMPAPNLNDRFTLTNSPSKTINGRNKTKATSDSIRRPARTRTKRTDNSNLAVTSRKTKGKGSKDK